MKWEGLHTNCHTWREAVRIEYNIWRHSRLCERHVLNRPLLAKREKKKRIISTVSRLSRFKSFLFFFSTNTGNLPQDKTRRIHEDDGMQFGRTFAIQVDIYDQTQILKYIINRWNEPCVANTASKAAQGVSLTFGGCSKKRGHNVKPKTRTYSQAPWTAVGGVIVLGGGTMSVTCFCYDAWAANNRIN